MKPNLPIQLHILTRPEDTLAREMIERQGEGEKIES